MNGILELTDSFTKGNALHSISKNFQVVRLGDKTEFRLGEDFAIARLDSFLNIWLFSAGNFRHIFPEVSIEQKLRIITYIQNSIIEDYCKGLGLPVEKFSATITSSGIVYTFGSSIVVQHTGFMAPFPFERNELPILNDDLQDALRKAGIPLIPKDDTDVEALIRDRVSPHMLTFIPKSKLKYFDTFLPLLEQEEHIEKYGMTGKPAKIISRTFHLNDKHREQFLNKFRVPELEFSIIEPKNIPDVYVDAEENSENDFSHTLGSSCMNGMPREWFDFYIHEARGIVVAKEDGNFCGRALLWDIEIEGKNEVLLDRIYTTDYCLEASFLAYAAKNGWYRKKVQDFKTPLDIVGPDDKPQKISYQREMQSRDYEHYPYTDTMKYVTVSNDKMTNDEDIARNWGEEYFRLENIEGGAVLYDEYNSCIGERFTDNQSTVWSDWYDEDIPEHEAVETYDNGWMYEIDIVTVLPQDRIYPRESEDIIQVNSGDYYHVDDCCDVDGEYYPQFLCVRRLH